MSILAYDFVIRALLGALFTGLAAPAVGTYLVQRRLALMGDGIGHVAVTGVALGLLTGAAPLLTAVIVATAGAITIELADYLQFDELRSVTQQVLHAFNVLPDFHLSYTRIGLRYINEIRAELVGIASDRWMEPKAWEPFVNSELLRTVTNPPSGLHAFIGPRTIFFHATESPSYISLEHGIHPQGIVNPDDVISLEGDSGPCFVLDFDAFRDGADLQLKSNHPDVIDITSELNSIVESAFQWSITEEAREVFRGPARSSSNEGPFPRTSNA